MEENSISEITPSLKDQKLGDRSNAIIAPNKRKMVMQIVIIMIYGCLLTGVLISYVVFEHVLTREGVYHSLCPPNTVVSCPAQNARYQLMYTLAVAGVATSSLVSGVFLDVYGVRYMSLAGCVVYLVGILLFALSSEAHFDAYIPGFFLMSFSGYTLLLAYLRIAEVFTKHRGIFSTAIINTFDITPLAYFVLDQISIHTNFPFRYILLIYAAFPASLIFLSLFFLPNNYVGWKLHRKTLANANAVSFWKLVFDHKYLLMLVYVSFADIRLEYFQGTYPARFRYLSGNDPEQSRIATLVSVISYPIIAVISVPVAGYALDHIKLTVFFMFAHVVALVFMVLACIPSIPVQYIAFEFAALFRAAFYTCVSLFVVNVYGYVYFGTLYGILFFVGGMANFINIWLIHVAETTYGGNPLPIDAYLSFIGVIFIFFNYLFYRWRDKMDVIKKEEKKNLPIDEQANQLEKEFDEKETQPDNNIERHSDEYN